MVEDREDMVQDEFRGARLRVYGTNRDNPDDGRVFVWTKMGWFERIEGLLGNVAFMPLAESEDELRQLIAQDDPNFDLTEIGGDHRKMVSEEFVEQSISDQDSPEQFGDDPSDEDEDQQYHRHDL
jgi:hypothetical protein